MSEQIGLKIGSQNTVLARRIAEEIKTTLVKTCIRYPKSALGKADEKPIIGDVATEYADSENPLRLGVINSEEGIQQTADILKTLEIPDNASIVLASPAVEMREGNKKVARALKLVCTYREPLTAFSEGLCSAVSISGVKAIMSSATAILSLNLGSTTMEVGCFYEGNKVHLSAHPEVCGNRVDEQIKNSIRNIVGDAVVTDRRIREMKEGTSLLNPKSFPVDAMTSKGIQQTKVSDEIIRPLKDYAKQVAEVFFDEVYNAIDPDIRNMAFKNPLYISGGMANIEGLPELIGEFIETKMHHKFEILYQKEGNSHIAPAIGALMLCEAIAEEQKGAQ